DPIGIAGGADRGDRRTAGPLPDGAGAARRRGSVEPRGRRSPGPQRAPREDSRAPCATVSPETTGPCDYVGRDDREQDPCPAPIGGDTGRMILNCRESRL